MALSQSTLTQIANKWHIPAWLLYGVYGKETDFGRNVTTSSAGAVGGFQFIPETAARYGYPLTNRPTKAQALQQADAAAHYLHDLGREKGSWDAALRGYSGGGYGEREVKAKASASGGGGFNILDPLGLKGPAEKLAAEGEQALGLPPSPGLPGSPFKSPVALGESVWKTLSDPATWFRVLKVVGGLALAYLAVMQFSRTAGAEGPPSPGRVARAVVTHGASA